ncbi:MAG: tetratricopeptide repeat protein [Candidatus Azobacteroides sp.]|nr:tetratricopeptide repeat protein [Candidatus Azobacteroides sp.]
MTQKNIIDLLSRYERMIQNGKSVYFDSDEFEEIADFYDMREDSNAVKTVIDEGLKQHPGHHGLLLKKVKTLIFDRSYDEALSLANHLTVNPTDSDTLLLKAEIFLNTNNPQSALSIFDVILEQSEDEYDFLDISDILKSVEMFREAVLYLEKGIEKFPNSIDLYREIGDNNRLLEEYDKAIVAYNKVLDIDPYSAEDWTDLGELYSLNGNYEKAIEAFDFSLIIDEDDDRTLYMKGNNLILNGNYEKAVETFLEYTQINNDDETPYILISECYTEMQDFEKAKYYALKALDVNKESILSLKKIIYLLLDREAFLESLPYLERAIELLPTDSNLLFLKADVLMSLDKLKEAEENYIQALTLSENEDEQIDIIYSLALLKQKQEKDEEAVFYYEKVELFKPAYPDLALKMAVAYANTGQYDKCVQYLQKAAEESTLNLTMQEIRERSAIIREIEELLNGKSG